MAKKREALQEVFVDFLANPAETGSQVEFAKTHNVSAVTLSKWKAKPEFWEKVEKRLYGHYLATLDPAMIKASSAKALNGDNRSLDRHFTLRGKIHGLGEPPAPTQNNQFNIFNIDREKGAELAQKFREFMLNDPRKHV